MSKVESIIYYSIHQIIWTQPWSCQIPCNTHKKNCINHLEITAARSALHQMRSGTDIINDWPLKPWNDKVCPLRINLHMQCHALMDNTNLSKSISKKEQTKNFKHIGNRRTKLVKLDKKIVGSRMTCWRRTQLSIWTNYWVHWYSHLGPELYPPYQCNFSQSSWDRRTLLVLQINDVNHNSVKVWYPIIK